MIIFVLVSNFCFGQNSPQTLGELFFTIFKSNNLKSLDTLIANCDDIKKMYLEIDSTSNILKTDDFCEKFDYRNTRFKKKCKRLRMDSTIYDIDWNNISIQKIDYSKNDIHNGTDSTYKTKAIMTNYLNIIFESNNHQYSIELKGIKKLNNSWKIGQQIRMREIKNE